MRHPAPRLLLMRASVNPNTGRFTAEDMGLFVDAETGRRYDGPWRIEESLPDGSRRRFGFAPPPAADDQRVVLFLGRRLA